jgi:hypothetical protein
VLACDQIITLVKHTAEKDGDAYTCFAIPNASWFSSVSISTSGDGAKPGNSYTVRIPAGNVPTGIAPAPGDYVVRGVLTSVSRPADMAGVEHFRATAVGDNRRGGLPHWKVSGS